MDEETKEVKLTRSRNDKMVKSLAKSQQEWEMAHHKSTKILKWGSLLVIITVFLPNVEWYQNFTDGFLVGIWTFLWTRQCKMAYDIGKSSEETKHLGTTLGGMMGIMESMDEHRREQKERGFE